MKVPGAWQIRLAQSLGASKYFPSMKYIIFILFSSLIYSCAINWHNNHLVNYNELVFTKDSIDITGLWTDGLSFGRTSLLISKIENEDNKYFITDHFGCFRIETFATYNNGILKLAGEQIITAKSDTIYFLKDATFLLCKTHEKYCLVDKVRIDMINRKDLYKKVKDNDILVLFKEEDLNEH